jgi:protease I
MKAIFIVPQIGFNEHELFTIRQNLEKNKIKCEIASFSKGKVISKEGTAINASEMICPINPDDYSCFIFVGGENVSSLVDHKCVINLIKKANKKRKIIALLCMNPALLLPKAGLLKGKRVTVFKTKNNWSENNIIKNKGILVDEPVVIDDNIITCRNEEDSELLAERIISKLNKKEK